MIKNLNKAASPVPGGPNAGSIPSGDRSMYSSDERLS
jgi:hypothetical protein